MTASHSILNQRKPRREEAIPRFPSGSMPSTGSVPTILWTVSILLVLATAPATAATLPSAPAAPWSGDDFTVSMPAPGVGADLLPILAGVLIAPVWALYRRIERATALDGESRRRLVDVVRSTPGLTLGEVSDLIGVSYKTGAHHARLLHELGILEMRRDGRFVRLYVPGRVTGAEKHVLEGAPGDLCRSVLSLLAREPHLNRPEVARRLNAKRSTVYWHVRQLEERGLLKRGEGAYVVEPDHRAALERLNERIGGEDSGSDRSE